jgi:hypothetical protein
MLDLGQQVARQNMGKLLFNLTYKNCFPDPSPKIVLFNFGGGFGRGCFSGNEQLVKIPCKLPSNPTSIHIEAKPSSTNKKPREVSSSRDFWVEIVLIL